jgi:hypothetical protein
MPLIQHDCAFGFCRLQVTLAELPGLLSAHRQRDPATRAIEAQAVRLAEGGFRGENLKAFIEAVCAWGGYSGVAGRVIKHNAPVETLIAAFRECHALLRANLPVKALERITALHSLGTSFGSKHLKFLAPDRAVVLDSVISGRLGYRPAPAGYAELLDDCYTLLRAVQAAGTPFPFPDEGRWRVSDIEMAIF